VSELVLVLVGGALGSGARYLVATWAATAGPGFPRGTLIVNLVGSFLISVVLEASLRTSAVSPGARLFLATGVMGGFTTYSSFNHETLRLLEEGAIGMALLNLGVTVVGCMGAGMLGLATVRVLLRVGPGLLGR
jgi:fluoride exporter